MVYENARSKSQSLYNDEFRVARNLKMFAGIFKIQDDTYVKTLTCVTKFLHRGSFKIISEMKNQQPWPWLIRHEFEPYEKQSVVSLCRKLSLLLSAGTDFKASKSVLN